MGHTGTFLNCIAVEGSEDGLTWVSSWNRGEGAKADCYILYVDKVVIYVISRLVLIYKWNRLTS